MTENNISQQTEAVEDTIKTIDAARKEAEKNGSSIFSGTVVNARDLLKTTSAFIEEFHKESTETGCMNQTREIQRLEQLIQSVNMKLNKYDQAIQKNTERNVKMLQILSGADSDDPIDKARTIEILCRK